MASNIEVLAMRGGMSRDQVREAVIAWARTVHKVPSEYSMAHLEDDKYGGFVVTFINPGTGKAR